MSSVSQRQCLLDLLYSVLKEPEKHGDKFFVQIVNGSKDGMIAVTSLQNMATALNDYPKAYIVHCIPLDQEQRFRQSCDGSKVGLISHPSNIETNEHGYVKYDDDPVTESTESSQQSVIRQLTNLDELSLKRDPVMPVVYSDGKFYVDTEPNKAPNFDEDSDLQKFKYDRLDIKPLGLQGEINHFEHFLPHCFNCGSEDHKLMECKLPIDKLKVAKSKRRKNQDSGPLMSRRLYMELDLQDKLSKAAPGVLSDTLKEALGMRSADDEPPYYRNMRANGYPPGYIGREGYQIPYGSKMTLDDVINTKAPLLKVYRDDGTDYQNDSIMEEVGDGSNKPNNVELVYYPGLNLIDTSKLDQRKIPQSNAPLHNEMKVQNDWELYYAQQGQYYSSHYAYPSSEQRIYPPGTQQESGYYDPVTAASAPPLQNETNVPLTNSQHFSNDHRGLSDAAHTNPIINSTIDESDDDMDISSDDDS